MGFLYTAASNENTAFDDAYSADYSSMSEAKSIYRYRLSCNLTRCRLLSDDMQQ